MFSLTFWTKCFWLSGVKNIVYSVVRGSGTFYDLIFAKSPVWCRGKGEMYFGVPQICKKKKKCSVEKFGVCNNCTEGAYYTNVGLVC